MPPRCRSAAIVVAFAALLLAACSSRDKPVEASQRILFSPNGEPLNGGALGRPKCEDALTRWFDRIDGDRDGTIERAEFMADARRQFAAMDLDHDGQLEPAELSHYRAALVGAPPPEEGDIKDPAKRRELVTGGPDPVMAADTSLRNRVDLPEFLAHAERVFAATDADHDGRLSRAEVLQRFCR